MNRVSYLGFVCALGVSILASACGDDDDDGAGKGGAPGTGGTSAGSGGQPGGAGSSNSGGSGGSGTGGASGGSAGATGGSAGAGGAAAGAGGSAAGGDAGSAGIAGSGGSGLDPQSTACSAFPKTVTLGDSISPTEKGAVLCFDVESTECRLTTNTYSDGVNPCSNEDTVVFFSFNSGSSMGRAQASEGWEWNSASAGTLANDTLLQNVAVDSEVTAEIERTGAAEYDLVFSFDGDNVFTIKKFAEKP